MDLGCGSGQTLVALAARLLPNAVLIGVDRRGDRLTDATSTDSRIKAVLADLNRPLPFSSASFDAAVCHNVLEGLTERAAFLAEVSRILRPRSFFLLGHSDFDTMIFNASDVSLTRRLIHAYADTIAPTMDAADGTMGRKVLEVAAESGMAVVETLAWVGLSTTFARGPAREAADAVASAARADASLSPRVDDWLADLESRDQDGTFLYSLNDYAVLLQKRR